MSLERQPANPYLLIHRRLWLGIGWGLVLLVIYLSLAATTGLPEIDYNDKLGHLLAYLTLMVWFAQLYPRRLPLALAFIVLGAGLEIAQGLSGYRDMAGADMLANAAGVGLGWLLAWPLPNLLGRLETLV